MPTIFWWPEVIEPNTVNEEIACTIDLLPTFAELAKCELPTQVIDGKSIKDLLVSDSATTPHEAIYYYDRDQLQAVRSGRWKLFLPLQDYSRHPHFNQKPNSRPLLFDLVEDVACQKDVAVENPNVVSRLEAFSKEARSELGDRGLAGAGMRQRGEVQNPTAQLLRSED